MKLHIYPPYKCYQTMFDFVKALFLSTKDFHEFFHEFFGNKNYLCTYRARNAIYHVLLYLKKNFHVTRVLVPSYMCNQVITPLKMSGLEIVFTDDDLNTLGMDVESADIRSNDVIFWPNIFGLKAEIPQTLRRKKVFIIEDNVTNFQKPSRNADFALYNFGKGKEISSSEGGLIFVNNKKFYNFLKETKLSSPGIRLEIYRYLAYLFWKLKTYRIIYFLGKYVKTQVSKRKMVVMNKDIEGKNFYMCSISKKIASVQLKKMPRLTKKSRRLAKFFINELKKIKGFKILEPPKDSNCFHVNFYVENNRDSLLSFLEKKQIFVTVPWGYLNNSNYLERKKPHKKYSYILDHMLELLINPSYMEEDDILYIVKQIEDWQKSQN